MNNVNSYPIDNNLILQPNLSPQFIVLNETAGIIWQNYEKGLSCEEICVVLCREYGISQEQAIQDMTSVFNSLESAGLFGNQAGGEFKPVNEENEITENFPICTDNQRKGIQVGYSFNEKDFRICYGNQLLKERTHALISHLEQKTAGKNVKNYNTYEYFQYKNQFAVKNNGRGIALEEEEFFARKLLYHEILQDLYPGIMFGAMIHAAAVEKDGRCILLSAPSGNGKSTLTAALVKQGFTYLGDDFIPLEASSFNALSVPFALSIKEGAWDPLRNFYPELDTLPVFQPLNKKVKCLTPPSPDRVQSSQRLPVRCIIHPKYDPGYSAGFKEISATDSFQKIIEAFSWIKLDYHCVFDFVNWLQHTKSYTLRYASLSDAVELMKDLLTYE